MKKEISNIKGVDKVISEILDGEKMDYKKTKTMKDRIIDIVFFLIGLLGVVFTLTFTAALIKLIYIILTY